MALEPPALRGGASSRSFPLASLLMKLVTEGGGVVVAWDSPESAG